MIELFLRRSNPGELKKRTLKKIDETKRNLCYKLVQALEKTSLLCLRPHKGGSTQTWDIMSKRINFLKSIATKLDSTINEPQKKDLRLEYS